MLGVFLGLVFVEQRHDLTDHVAHWIVAELLCDRHQPDASPGKSADIKRKLKLVAKEAAEAVDQYDVERRRLCCGRVDHALELRSPIVGRGRAGLDVLSDDLPAARCAVSLRLTALIRDGEIVVGLPPRRDSEIESRPNCRCHGDVPLSRLQIPHRTTRQTTLRTRRYLLRSPVRLPASHPSPPMSPKRASLVV